MKIVLVEDNRNLAKSIMRLLKEEQFSATHFLDGEKAETFLFQNHDAIDLIILDIMLPGKSGLDICTHLRERQISVPILMLTARDTLEDKVTGLHAGADDYLAKPFALEELFARIHALLRRPPVREPERTFLSKNIVFDTAARKVLKNNREIPLTATEFNILEFLIRHKNTVVSQQKIYDHCFDFAKNPNSNTVEVHIKNLRKKLSTDEKKELIKTIRGIGYCLEVQ